MSNQATDLAENLAADSATDLANPTGDWRAKIASGVLDLYYGNDGIGSGQEVFVSGELDQWDDSIGGYPFTAPAAGARPDDNGSDGYLFTAANSERLDNQTAGFLTTFGDNDAWSMAVRITLSSTLSVGTVWSWSHSATTRCFLRMGAGGSTPNMIFRHGSAVDVSLGATSTFGVGDTFTVTITYDGAGTVTMFVNGTQEDQATEIDAIPLDGDAAVFTIGASSLFGVPASASPLDGNLHEMIVASKAWSTVERSHVESNLATEWP